MPGRDADQALHSPPMVSTTNSCSSPRSTKSSATRVLGRERLEVGEQRPSPERRRRAGRRRAAASPGAPLLRRRGRSAARPPRGCGAPGSWPRGGRSGRRPSSTPPPTITKYCGTRLAADLAHAALEAEAGDVVLAAAVRAAADLDVEVGAASATRSGRAARWSASKRPSPRDWVTASRQASAPGQLVTSAMVLAPPQVEAGGGEAAVERRHVGASGPSGRRGSARGSCGPCRRRRRAARSASTRSCSPVRSPRGTVTVTIAIAGLLLRAHVGRAPSGASSSSSTVSTGRDRGRECRGREHGARQHARGRVRRAGARSAAAPRAPSRRAGPRGRTAAARAALGAHVGQSSASNSARQASQPRVLDQELHPVALLVLVVAEAVEDAQHRLGHVEDLARGQELEEQPGRRAQDRRAAAGGDPEAARAGAVRRGRRARKPRSLMAVERVVLGAALEGDLELARQRRAQRMAQQVARQRLGVGRDVEHLVRRRRRRTGTR